MKKIFVVIAYDVCEDHRRTDVCDLLSLYGQRVNYSVFECLLTPKKLEIIFSKLEKMIDLKTDRVIFYTICKDCQGKILRLGILPALGKAINVV